MNSGIFERQHFRQRDRSVTLPFASAQGRLAQGDDCLDYLSINEKVECVGFVFKLRGMALPRRCAGQVVPVLLCSFFCSLKRFGVVCSYVLALGCQGFFAGVL
jgi:hypothetical protein